MTDTQPAPTVPDEAVEAIARAIEPWAFRYDEDAIEGCIARASARRQAREGLTAAAPFIVAANQPDAAEHPDLDAIRARVNTKGSEFVRHARADVRALLAEVERLRAQRDAVLALHRSDSHATPALATCWTCSSAWPCATARALTGDVTP